VIEPIFGIKINVQFVQKVSHVLLAFNRQLLSLAPNTVIVLMEPPLQIFLNAQQVLMLLTLSQ
jgi:hypothetical protein